ncbi:MAG: FMN-binding protein [Jatrophihabitans sp.]|uniref:FMN-binding protein n=1 Tax=Jatrophihabitans sp. TaxID=1932789 RepID=UPI003F7E57C4
MKRVIASVLGTIAGLVMLLDFKSHSTSLASIPAASLPTTGTGGTTSGAGTGGNTGTATTPTGGSTSSAAPKARATSGSRTYTGSAVDTVWGPVQVQITVSNGKITKATAVVFPLNNGRDQEINSYAIPALQQETIKAQSAQIDMVSGATYTSTGYIRSLQSALNQAGLS